MTDPDRPHPFPDALTGRYRYRGTIGQGGMGMVFRAHDLELDRDVAIKIALAKIRGAHLERFRREAAGLAALRHPNILPLYDFGELDIGPYLVTEFVDGGVLAQVPRGHTVVSCLMPVADALEAVHDAGLIHRDVKLANILITRDGRPVLADFGLLKDEDAEALTRTGVAIGTPQYMAPELIRLGRTTPGADWFAWGVCLYRLAEGRFPLELEGLKKILLGADWPPLTFQVLDPDGPVASLVRACLDPDPERRPHSRMEIEALLEEDAPRLVTSAAGPIEGAASPEAPALDARRSEVSGEALTEPRSGQPVPGVSRAGLLPRVVGAGLAALAAAGLLVSWGQGRVEDPVLPSAGPARPSEAASPAVEAPLAPEVDEFLVQALLADWDQLPMLRAEPGPLGAGRGPLLDSDPLLWPQLVRRLPSLQEVQRLAASGHLLGLAPAIRARLVRVDEGYASEGLRRPFFPFLDLRPHPGEVSAVEEAEVLRGRVGLDAPSRVSGWLAAAVLAQREARRRLADPSFDGRNLARLMESNHELMATPHMRRSFVQIMGPVTEAGVLALAALARSAIHEPETAPVAASLALRWVDDLEDVWPSPYGLDAGPVVLGAPPTGDALLAIHAAWTMVQRGTQRGFGLATDASDRRRVEQLEAALEAARAVERGEAWRAQLEVRALWTRSRLEGDDSSVLDRLSSALARRRAWPPPLRGWLLALALDVCHGGDRGGLDGAALAEELEQLLPDLADGWQRSLRVSLEEFRASTRPEGAAPSAGPGGAAPGRSGG